MLFNFFAKAIKQYLVWVDDGEEEESDIIVSNIFECLDGDREEKDVGKKARGRSRSRSRRSRSRRSRSKTRKHSSDRKKGKKRKTRKSSSSDSSNAKSSSSSQSTRSSSSASNSKDPLKFELNHDNVSFQNPLQP